MQNSIFDQMDFGPLQEFLDDDDVTDVSYSNGGQVWLKTLSRGIYQVERPAINNTFMEKLAFQCSNVMGKTFNMAHPFLDAESAELRMNFVHESIATNGVACLLRKTPAKIRLNKDKLLSEQYVTEQIHDFLINCVHGRCNIIVAGETGSGKTELVKYLASKTKEDEKIISIEDTLELHLAKIYPTRDIVEMKTNNIASYTEALVACMRQNPIWILLSEVRSAEAVMAVRNSISSGHHILSTIHADKASSIPMRMYSLLESSQDIEQFLGSIHRYVQIGIYVKGYYSQRLGRFQREILEICEFYIDENNQAASNVIYQKYLDGRVVLHNPTKNLIEYLKIGNVDLPDDTFGLGPSGEGVDDTNRVAAEMAAKDNAAVKPVEHKADEDPFNMNGDDAEAPAGGEEGGATPEIPQPKVETPAPVQQPVAPVQQVATPVQAQPQVVVPQQAQVAAQQPQVQQVSQAPSNQGVAAVKSSTVVQPAYANVAPGGQQVQQQVVQTQPRPAVNGQMVSNVPPQGVPNVVTGQQGVIG